MIRGLRTRLRRTRSDLYRLERSGRARVGQATYGDPRIYTYAHDHTGLAIGSFTSIARDVRIVLGGNHRLDTVSTFPLRIRFNLDGAGEDGYPWSKGDVDIGSDVWIGVGATILSGVTIGHGAVISAGAVVVNDVRPFAVVAGVPAREVKRRFEDDICDALLTICWWDWPLPLVLQLAQQLASPPTIDTLKTLERARLEHLNRG